MEEKTGEQSDDIIDPAGRVQLEEGIDSQPECPSQYFDGGRDRGKPSPVSLRTSTLAGTHRD